jgi:putative membrane protein
VFDLTAFTSALPVADWDGPGWWIVFAPLGWFLVIATFIVLLRVFVFRGGGWGGPGGPRYGGRLSAAEVLERRFAEGELSAAEYRERRAVLEDSPPSGEEIPREDHS